MCPDTPESKSRHYNRYTCNCTLKLYTRLCTRIAAGSCIVAGWRFNPTHTRVISVRVCLHFVPTRLRILCIFRLHFFFHTIEFNGRARARKNKSCWLTKSRTSSVDTKIYTYTFLRFTCCGWLNGWTVQPPPYTHTHLHKNQRFVIVHSCAGDSHDNVRTSSGRWKTIGI